MSITGGCYCGQVRYAADGPARFRGQCFCRECQHISGGAGNLFMIVGADDFRYVQGEPARFTRSDLEAPGTREFCAVCGTHLTTRSPRDPSIVILKVGTLDDPSIYEGPQAVLWTDDAQAFHQIPAGAAAFPGFPG